MNRLRIPQLAVVALVTTFPGACADEQLTAPVGEQASRSTRHRQYSGAWWYELGHLIPGYGGHFLDPDVPRAIWLYLLDPETQAERARSVLSRRELSWTAALPTTVRILQGRYHVFDLLRWKREVSPLISAGGDIWGVGVAFDTNQVALLVNHPGTDLSMVRRRIKAVDVPLGAVRIDEMELPPPV